jgi:flagellar hook-basal body complex protein FliE
MTAIDSSKLLAMRTAILEQNTALQRAAGAGAAGLTTGTPDSKSAGFGDALQSALAEVNALQAQSSAATTAYEKGETTDIAAVMLARQKSSLAFEATLQVRNKLLSAYKDIMSMPV